MIAIIPLVFLIFRLRHFNFVARAASNAELHLAERYSFFALASFLLVTVATFFVPDTPQLRYAPHALLAFALLLAAAFDLKAQRVVRRCGVQKDTEKALAVAGKKALSLDRDAEALFSEAINAEVKKDFEKAIGLYKQVIAVYPESSAASQAQNCVDVLEKRRSTPS